MSCRLYRWYLGCALDDGEPLSPRLEAHLRECAECRQFYDSQRFLIAGLRRESASSAAPAGLTERVQAAVAGQTGRILTLPRPARLRWLPAAAAALLVFCAGGWWWNQARIDHARRQAEQTRELGGLALLIMGQVTDAAPGGALSAAGRPLPSLVGELAAIDADARALGRFLTTWLDEAPAGKTQDS